LSLIGYQGAAKFFYQYVEGAALHRFDLFHRD